jgi:membrane-bound lytic murein transglycosylase A
VLRRLLRFAAAAALLGALAPAPGCVRPKLPPRSQARALAPEPLPAKKDYDRPLPKGAWALRKVDDPRLLPDLAAAFADTDGVGEAVERSLSYLAKPSSRRFFPVSGVSHAHVVRSLEVVAQLLDEGLSGAALAAEVERRFDVYMSIGCDDRGTVLFTGYYTPVFHASRERTERFRHPLHRPPAAHEKDLQTGETLGLRQADGSIDPDYPARDELLSSGLLEGQELAWLEHAYEAYIIGVQGSAVLRMTDGTDMGVAYAGTNGHPYASIGRALIDAGKLRPDELNLRRLITYFEQHPEDFGPLAAKNRRYVYFQEGDGTPRGCLNEEVTALRSIAADKAIFPRGSLVVIDVDLPDRPGKHPWLVLDQDAGGAIRAPGRCDVYMGVGDDAGELAGHTLAEGQLFYLLAKDSELYAVR